MDAEMKAREYADNVFRVEGIGVDRHSVHYTDVYDAFTAGSASSSTTEGAGGTYAEADAHIEIGNVERRPDFQKLYNEAVDKPTFFCIHREGRHEIGCSCRSWAVEELRRALISSKASHLAYARLHPPIRTIDNIPLAFRQTSEPAVGWRKWPEEKPEYDGHYLVYEYPPRTETGCDVAWYQTDDDPHWSLRHLTRDDQLVAAWMPLPAPYDPTANEKGKDNG